MYADIREPVAEIKDRLEKFMNQHIYPNEEAHKLELAMRRIVLVQWH